MAATSGCVPLAVAAISKGFDMNVRDTTASFTPLHFAAMQGKKAMVKYLIGHGADSTVI